MNSINKNQEEKNREDFMSKDAIGKVKELIDKSPTCFFCTSQHLGESDGVRPMSVQKTDDEGNLWFLSPNDSYKNKEIEIDSAVKLFFQGSAHSDFLYLEGKASVSEDKNMIKELWEPVLKTWFTEGIDDPRISVIKVAPYSGYYWDTKHGNFVAGVKMLVGAVAGKTMDDSIEGTIKL